MNWSFCICESETLGVPNPCARNRCRCLQAHRKRECVGHAKCLPIYFRLLELGFTVGENLQLPQWPRSSGSLVKKIQLCCVGSSWHRASFWDMFSSKTGPWGFYQGPDVGSVEARFFSASCCHRLWPSLTSPKPCKEICPLQLQSQNRQVSHNPESRKLVVLVAQEKIVNPIGSWVNSVQPCTTCWPTT